PLAQSGCKQPSSPRRRWRNGRGIAGEAGACHHGRGGEEGRSPAWCNPRRRPHQPGGGREGRRARGGAKASGRGYIIPRRRGQEEAPRRPSQTKALSSPRHGAPLRLRRRLSPTLARGWDPPWHRCQDPNPGSSPPPTPPHAGWTFACRLPLARPPPARRKAPRTGGRRVPWKAAVGGSCAKDESPCGGMSGGSFSAEETAGLRRCARGRRPATQAPASGSPAGADPLPPAPGSLPAGRRAGLGGLPDWPLPPSRGHRRGTLLQSRAQTHGSGVHLQ
ncbi:PREDICTED: translation initiation factor IF-2-like, partial [Gekko japonicus]|uniref:Translation initiation factor IF-2-like n=1 Tax=Gekko japonicus TaxID=146911 RepID=A0ABM1K7F3_GEKJA